MRHPKLLLLLALLSTGILRAQAPAQSNPTRTPDMAQPLPVPGGGAGLGPGGIPKPEDQHTPTLEESRQKAKEEGEQMADLQARRLAQQLNLDLAQTNRVRHIFIEREDQLRKTMQPEAVGTDQQPLTPQERQLKIKEIKEEALRKVQGVLKPDQKQQFDTMMAHGNAERARRAGLAQRAASRAPNGAGPAPAANPQTPAPTAPATNPAPATPPQSNR
jgi:hypothetical protein